jgi:hypothetical protein
MKTLKKTKTCTKQRTKNMTSYYAVHTVITSSSPQEYVPQKHPPVVWAKLIIFLKIPPSSLHTFQTHYSNLLKSSLAPHMRKRDKKREKARAEQGAKRRKEVYTDVEITGAKRGKGHKQRVCYCSDI